MASKLLAARLHLFRLDLLEDGENLVDLVSSGNNLLEGVGNLSVVEVELVADLIGESGHEGLEDVTDEVDEVDGDVADGSAELGVGLQHGPGLGVLEVLVSEARDLHGPAESGLEVCRDHGLVVPTWEPLPGTTS